MLVTFDAVLKALRANFGWAINDHRVALVPSYDKSPIKIDAIAKCGDHVVALRTEKVVHTLQTLYVDDGGQVHLSTFTANENHGIGFIYGVEKGISSFNDIVAEDDSLKPVTDLTYVY